MAFSSHFKGVLSLSSAQFEQGLTKAQGKVKTFNKELSGMFTRFLGATAVVSFGKSVLDSTAKLGDMSKRLGVSTDFLQKFNFAMEQSGVDSNSAQVGLQRFIRRIGTAREEGGALKAELDKMNISLNDTNGNAKTGEQLFLEFADGLAKIQNPSTKLATAFKFVDSEGIAMLQTIGNSSGEFDKLGRKAEELGLIIDGNTIRSMQDLDAELKKSEAKFKVLGAKILPNLLKALNLAVLGWEGIYNAVKTAITGFELFGKTIKQYVEDTLEKAGASIELFVANANVQIAKLNPFADANDVKVAQENLDKVEKAYADTAQRTSQSFMQTRDDILKKDTELADKRTAHIKDFQRVNNEINNLLQNRNTLDMDDNDLLKEKEKIMDRVVKAREDINVKLQTQVDRIKALKEGGEEELQRLIERQKVEEQIGQLMQDGLLTREQAEERVTTLLELEKEEKDILEQLKKEEKEREEAKKRLSENNALVLKLEEEKKLQQEIKDLVNQEQVALQMGNVAQANKIAQKRIGLILDNTELANRDAEKIKLNDNLQLVRDKRDAVDQELQILNLIAQGRDGEAKQLKDKIKLQKEINDLMNDLNINEKDAINKVDQRLRLEKKIELNKLDQKKQIIINNAIEENAQKKITLGLSKEERARIRASKAYVKLDEQVQDLQGKADARSLRMLADLEARKTGKLDLILTDETKSELSKIETSRTEIETDFNLQLKALDDRLVDIQNAEVKKKQDDAEREVELKKKQDELLAKAREAEDALKDKLVEVGDKAKDSLVDGFNSVMEKLKDLRINNNVNVDMDTALGSLTSTLQNMPTPPAPIVNIPSFPDPAPVSVSVDVDTESLLTEQTGIDIKTTLEGKFVNQ